MLVVDVDLFSLNDRYGRLAGDETLAAIAVAMEGALLRSRDACGRFGGEELVVVLPDTDEWGSGCRRTHQGRGRDPEPSARRSPIGLVSVGVGAATCRPGTPSGGAGEPDAAITMTWRSALFLAADTALYRAKAAGPAGRCSPRRMSAGPGGRRKGAAEATSRSWSHCPVLTRRAAPERVRRAGRARGRPFEDTRRELSRSSVPAVGRRDGLPRGPAAGDDGEAGSVAGGVLPAGAVGADREDSDGRARLESQLQDVSKADAGTVPRESIRAGWPATWERHRGLG